MSSIVNKGLKVRIFPDKSMEQVLKQNMGNARFIWNNILNQYNELYKSKKNPKQSFRIQKNGNNIRITNKRIRLAKLGYIHYRTSKEYKKLLKKSKINNVTVKRKTANITQ